MFERLKVTVCILCTADRQACIYFFGGTAVAQWLRCCVTIRKVAGSIPAGVSGFFIDKNPSDRTMALGSTQPLTEMSNEVKAASA